MGDWELRKGRVMGESPNLRLRIGLSEIYFILPSTLFKPTKSF